MAKKDNDLLVAGGIIGLIAYLLYSMFFKKKETGTDISGTGDGDNSNTGNTTGEEDCQPINGNNDHCRLVDDIPQGYDGNVPTGENLNNTGGASTGITVGDTPPAGSRFSDSDIPVISAGSANIIVSGG